MTSSFNSIQKYLPWFYLMVGVVFLLPFIPVHNVLFGVFLIFMGMLRFLLNSRPTSKPESLHIAPEEDDKVTR